MRTLSKAILWLFASVAVVSLALCIWIVVALKNEARLSTLYSAFGTLAVRALQMDRVGNIAELVEYHDPVVLPREVLDDPSSLSCSSKIVIPQFDASRYVNLGVVFADKSPITVYLLYSGPPPDLSRFLDPRSADYLFGDPTQESLRPGNTETMDPPDYSSAMNEIIRGRTFVWESYECPAFTYTIIREN